MKKVSRQTPWALFPSVIGLTPINKLKGRKVLVQNPVESVWYDDNSNNLLLTWVLNPLIDIH